MTQGDRRASFLRVKLPVYCLSFNSMDHFVLAVSMNGLIRSFPGVSETALMYLLTVGTLAAVAGSFVFSFLSARYTKKNLSVISLIVGCGCALLYLLFPKRLPILFAAGAGQGLVSGAIATAFPLLVNAHVAAGERGKVMGTGSGMIQFGRLTTFLLAGFLANIQWNLVYLVYGFMLAALLMIIFLLPQDVLPQKSEIGAKDTGERPNPWLKAAKSAGIWRLTMTTNYEERGVLASWRQTTANIFVLAMSATFLPMVLAIGGGDQAKGFTPTAGIYLLISIPFFLICFSGVKERVIPPSSAEKIPLRESFKCLKGNIPAIMLCAVYFIWGFSGAFISSGLMYFWSYVAGNVEHFSSNMSFMMAGGMVAGVAIGLMVKVVKNKRNIGMFSWIIAAATHILKFFIPVADPSTWWMFDALTFINGVFGQLGFICVIAMVPDITEYTQLKHGLRASGFIFACINFMNKLGTSIAQGIFSWVLAAQNYTPGEAQPQNIVTTISAFLTIIPGLVTLLGVVSFFFYKLNRSTHESALNELGIR
ncbi:MAG: MFS transporter [Peptococcaceae bacterium]|jgi:Na+/melibiose symporter-like transporter|nr:MFS transporter [Peptococcaceae bacterium]